jgi:hypothetical protein
LPELSVESIVSFVQPQGVSLREIMNAINEESQKCFQRDTIYRGNIFKIKSIDESCNKDVLHQVIPMVANSANKIRSEQEALLESRGLKFALPAPLAIVAGLYRLKHGFPSSAVGTKHDIGDIFKGFVVRTANCGPVRDLSSYVDGVYDSRCSYVDVCSDYIVAAGYLSFGG